LDSGEGATDHALLDREVCARDNGSPLHRPGSTVLMVSDPRFTEFANRIAAQCVRLGVRHTIDPQSPQETLRSKLPMLWPNSQRLPASRQHPPIARFDRVLLQNPPFSVTIFPPSPPINQ